MDSQVGWTLGPKNPTGGLAEDRINSRSEGPWVRQWVGSHDSTSRIYVYYSYLNTQCFSPNYEK